MKIVCIGNYPPRRCGIATFTKNLLDAVAFAAAEKKLKLQIKVAAMNAAGEHITYPDMVFHVITDNNLKNYAKAADIINNECPGVVMLQHEFGIFGGVSGSWLLALLSRLNAPLLTTLHTVLEKPSFHESAIFRNISHLSSAVVVMSQLAIKLAVENCGIATEKLIKIEHGVPDFEHLPVRSKEWFPENDGRRVILTFGLLGRNKGIETVIRALPQVVSVFPETLYIILGKTHPNIVKHCGEEYREWLEQLCKQYNVLDNVLFINEHVSEIQLMHYLRSADLYITPYLNKSQITSGTLSYALGAGLPIISTPYWHAEELLANERGFLFGFANHNQLSELIIKLFTDDSLRISTCVKAEEYFKAMTWPNIGAKYLDLIHTIKPDKTKCPSEIYKSALAYKYPTVSFRHLNNLTDSNGVMQHSFFNIPDRSQGYCLDDNARTLLLLLMAKRQAVDGTEQLIQTCLSFILFMQDKKGWFRNFMNYKRHILSQPGSEDAYGRTMWALGYLIMYPPGEATFEAARLIFAKALTHASHLRHSRGIANTIIGLSYFLKRYPDNAQINDLLRQLANTLAKGYIESSSDQWCWYEAHFTYDNSILPVAMMHAAAALRCPQLEKIAVESAEYLSGLLFCNKNLSIVGNKQWYHASGRRTRFAQQPVETMGMIIMCSFAYKTTGKQIWKERMLMAFDWFYGRNDIGLPLYDHETRGCCDGLEYNGVNRNQGAESTIAYLISCLTVSKHLQMSIDPINVKS